MKYFFLPFILILGCQLNIRSQHRGTCGVSTNDQIIMHRIFKDNHTHVDLSDWNRNEFVDIPVKFHVYANTDGSGKIPITAILNQLCILNRDFAEYKMRFYLSGDINFVNSSNPNQNPGLFENQLAIRKVNDAVNVFVTRNATTPGGDTGPGTTLGYYSPSRDWIVVRQDQVTASSNTLSHEMGHFFSLPHTFFGWESDPYVEDKHGNPVLLINAPGTNIPVELMDGSNCDIAADKLCDTPPDYGFGNLTNNCVFNLDVRDRNNERIYPMVNNQMSYFSNCQKFVFTPNQAERMNLDYLTPRRSYLRTGYSPINDSITTIATLLKPINDLKIEEFNGIHFEWTPVENATHYILEVIGPQETNQYLATTNEFYVTNLRPNGRYNWRVRAFNEGFTCTDISENGKFRTGNVMTNVIDTEFIQKLKVYPNPALETNVIHVAFSLLSYGDLTIKINDATGRRVLQKTFERQHPGDQTITLDIQNLTSGFYFLEMVTDQGNVTKKLYISN